MSNNGRQIVELLNTPLASAPDVTKPLKAIGNGNMLEGVKNIFNYALEEGRETGLTKGKKYGLAKGSAVTLGVCGILYLIPKGINYIKKKKEKKRVHDEMGEKIHVAFNAEQTARPSEGGVVLEEAESSDK